MARGPAVFPRPQDYKTVDPDSPDRSIDPYADSPKGVLWNRGREANTSDALRADNAPGLDCPPRSGATSDGTTKGKTVDSAPSGAAGQTPYGTARNPVSRGSITRVPNG